MKGRLITLPFLVPVWLLAILYANNAGSIPPAGIILPLAVALASAAVVFLAAKLVFRDAVLSCLAASPLILLLFSFGSVFEYLSNCFIGHAHGRLMIILIMAAIAAAYMLYIGVLSVFRDSGRLTELNLVFNVIVMAMLLFNIGRIAQASRNGDELEMPEIKSMPDNAAKPDIYYIILDQFASTAEFEALFGRGDGGVSGALEKKGFFIARESESKCVATNKSIAAALDMKNIGDSADNGACAAIRAKDSSEMEESKNIRAFRLIRNNRAARILQSFGYKFINLGSWYPYTSYNRHADRNINCFWPHFSNELADLMFRASVLRFAYISRGFYRNSVLYAFSELGRMPGTAGPKFVFAHIICPHLPYVFGENGEKVPFGETRNFRNRSLYRAQYLFVSKKVAALADEILSGSKTPPAIIIQSDHGSKLSSAYAHRIFNAIYLPGGGDRILNKRVSPQNIFRLVLNRYFGQSLEVLPDN